ncbi:phenylalanine--tRNA ligase subunit beta [Cryomorpha ignava]|uniref:Phenylalanine--tRNA ligase beta subunit n=1 Tax=Cryomorpha ignava TaxID=101383 RepID=A0A7K3WSG3_9FLAO|nr:phenylalanine--tRNA ligase subunit beta [Cryomorpha ignava]NEN24011.1 phenylalanine--tRNA ligase subunit beta [Cryomorpha ignava]
MKVSYNWLQSYLKLDQTPEQVAEILTDTGLEVEKLEKWESVPGGLEGVMVGHVVDLWPHPNADKLNVTKVDLGIGEPVQIVCGAPNVAKGQKVLVATVGTTLMPEPGKPFEIKKAKIRGEESFGMICAEDELGIGTSHAGIMVLPGDTKMGITAADYLGLETDYVFEIGLTPNRTDGFGHYGVARDIAARLSLKKQVGAEKPELKKLDIYQSEKPKISVEIRDKQGCGRYAGLLIENIKVQPSPEWLQNRLRAIGQTPINNVVDITNFVLHEMGQPLHAFDAARIKGNKIVIDTLPKGTKFTTLDEVERVLDEKDLMICNGEGGMCIAGVFGGIRSGVSDHTTSVFLESAWFNPVRIRKTAKRHGLNTDASFRFERGVDPNGTVFALKRAANLILEIAGGEVVGPLIDEITEIPQQVALDFSLERFNSLAGTNLDEQVVTGILKSLDFEIESTTADKVFKLKVPTYRADVHREVDVVEEVLRIYGYNNVEMPDQMRISVSVGKKPARHEVIQALGQALVGRGFSEMMSNGLTRSDYIKEVTGNQDDKSLVYMLNPLSEELDVLRPDLTISMLESVAYNLNRQADRLMLFEIGKSYEKVEDGYRETTKLAIALAGTRFRESWSSPADASDSSDLRGHINAVFQIMGLEASFGDSGKNPFYGSAVSVHLRRKNIGILGSISKKAMKRYGIKRDVLVAEFDLDSCLKAIGHASKTLTSLTKFPSVRRDLSLLLNENVGFEEIEKIAYAKAGKFIKEIGLFDVYEGKSLPTGKKSYAVSFVLQDENKTLNDKQIDKTMKSIQSELETVLGASLR